METLSFSIITVTLNSEKYLSEALDSILEQDYTNKELIVVDGGSTDSTIDILKSYGDKVRFLSEPDKGISDAMNKGIRMSRGEIIAHLHSDDRYMAGALSTAVEVFTGNPDLKWLIGKGNYINEKGEDTGLARSGKYSYEKLKNYNFIFHPATFVRREVFDVVGYFDKSLQYAMDYDMWMRIGKAYEPFPSDEVLTSFRRHSDSFSTRNAVKAIDEEYTVRKRYCGDELLFRKIFFFLRYKAARTAKILKLS